ncbi:MAG: alpha/beta family hydrolase [Terracidiphilus sp.]
MLSELLVIHDIATPEAPVRGLLHRPAEPGEDALILTHGAGSNCNAPLLVLLAEGFCAAGLPVLRCDLPFRQLRPHGPPSPGTGARDRLGLHAAVDFMRQRTPGRIFLGGHSYGGRQASMLAADQPGLVNRLLFLSYPLHPPEKPEKLRTGHFSAIQTPALFVHGTRDTFGSLAEVESALGLIHAPTGLLPVTGAGHELLTKQNRETLPAHIVQRFLSFTLVPQNMAIAESA